MAEEYGSQAGTCSPRIKEERPAKRFAGRKQPFMAFPYQVKPGASRFIESTARSRGFKFAVLSGSAAYFAKASKVIVPESGQGALGPTLVPVGQAYEDYRNHPRFMKHMTAFFKALLGCDIAFVFPRLWFTKGETLKAYMALSGGKNVEWSKTRSCWQDNRHVSVNNHRRQCGICAACMLRRLSVHAADLTEPADTYVWEDLSAPTFDAGAARDSIKKTLRAKAICNRRHVASRSSRVFKAVACGRTATQSCGLSARRAPSVNLEAAIRPKLDRLLSQHQKEWKTYMNSLGPQSFVVQWADNDQST